VDALDDKAVACYVLHFKADNQSLASPIFGGKMAECIDPAEFHSGRPFHDNS